MEKLYLVNLVYSNDDDGTWCDPYLFENSSDAYEKLKQLVKAMLWWCKYDWLITSSEIDHILKTIDIWVDTDEEETEWWLWWSYIDRCLDVWWEWFGASVEIHTLKIN